MGRLWSATWAKSTTLICNQEYWFTSLSIIPDFWSAVESESKSSRHVSGSPMFASSKAVCPIPHSDEATSISCGDPFRDDRAEDLQEKIDDYLEFGILTFGSLTPEAAVGMFTQPEGSYEAKDGILRTAASFDRATLFEGFSCPTGRQSAN